MSNNGKLAQYANQPKETAENTAPKDGKSRPNILLNDDSMFKDINPHKLSNKLVRKLRYPEKRDKESANDVLST